MLGSQDVILLDCFPGPCYDHTWLGMVVSEESLSPRSPTIWCRALLHFSLYLGHICETDSKLSEGLLGSDSTKEVVLSKSEQM